MDMADTAATVVWAVREGSAARPAVAHYRLSRKEYQNTVYDLLGVRYDPTKPGELNEDTLWHGFERVGSELSLSPSHVDRYYGAAGLVLDRAFSVPSRESRKVHKTAADLGCGIGVLLPFTPVAGDLGFTPLPGLFLLFLAGATATYLLLVELVKRRLMRRLIA